MMKRRYVPRPPGEAVEMQPAESPPLQEQSTLSVFRTFPDGTESDDEAKIDVHFFVVPPAHATAGVKRTVNLGNYESLSIEARVTLPCYAEEIEEGIDRASAIASHFLKKEITEFMQARKEGS